MQRSNVARGETALRALSSVPFGSPSGATTCVIFRNPFDHADREAHAFHEPMRLSDIAARFGVNPAELPVICRVDGKWCLQKTWGVAWVSPGSVVEFHFVVQNGRNFLATALSLALVVAASVFAGPAGTAVSSALGLGTLGTNIATAVIGAAIIAGGSFAVNALLPPPRPGDNTQATGASPTYTLGLQNNQARPGQPIPVVYGYHRIYCDYAATPYLIADTHQLYLRALFMVGQGEYDLTYLRIGSTFLDSFPGVQLEIIEPGNAVTLFPHNVYAATEVGAQTLLGPSEAGHDWVGPFPASPPGKVARLYSLIFAFPQGLFRVNTETGALVSQGVEILVEAREIDDLGFALSGWIAIDGFTATDSVSEARYFERPLSFATAARREFRVKRSSDKPSTFGQSTVVWQQLTGEIVGGPTTFPNDTLVALVIRYTNSLTPTTSRIFNVEVTRKLPIWGGTAWSAPTTTRSIAWALADINRNQIYGAGLQDSRLDIDGLLDLDEEWAGRDDTFNAIYDQSTTVADARNLTAAAGRARPYNQSGLIRHYRDKEQVLPVAMFSVSNIVLDSFRLEFAVPVDGESADGVTGEFLDETSWKQNSVTAGVDDEEPEDPATERLFGITTIDQARREVQYKAAANRYRRIFLAFQTELSGLLISPGDPILIAHDVPAWGFAGDVQSYDPTTKQVRIRASYDLDTQYTWTVYFRDVRGRPSKAIGVTPGIVGDRFVLNAAPTYQDGTPFTIVTDDDMEPTHFALGRSSQDPKLAIVTNIVPRGGQTVEVQAVLEDPRVHVN